MNETSAKLISKHFNRPLVFVDLETTGIGARSHEILEVAAIRIEHGEVTGEFSSLVKPRHNRVSPVITGITGIRNSDIIDAPFFEDVAAPVIELFKGKALFVAHNVGFDYSFLSTAYNKLGVHFYPDLFCTVKMSRALYGKERKHSLETIIRYHDIAVENRHRAYDDAWVMWEFMQIAWQEKGEMAFGYAVEQQEGVLPPDDKQIDLDLVQ